MLPIICGEYLYERMQLHVMDFNWTHILIWIQLLHTGMLKPLLSCLQSVASL
jgi:hypothetical protein